MGAIGWLEMRYGDADMWHVGLGGMGFWGHRNFAYCERRIETNVAIEIVMMLIVAETADSEEKEAEIESARGQTTRLSRAVCFFSIDTERMKKYSARVI